jgi:hypothetical protein
MIRENKMLKNKICCFVNSLVITEDNMQDVRCIFDHQSTCYVLEDIAQAKILHESLQVPRNSDYLIKCFTCFLTYNLIQGEEMSQQRRKWFGMWIAHVENDRATCIDILKAIDELLGALEQAMPNDWFSTYVIDIMLHICFDSGKTISFHLT